MNRSIVGNMLAYSSTFPFPQSIFMAYDGTNDGTQIFDLGPHKVNILMNAITISDVLDINSVNHPHCVFYPGGGDTTTTSFKISQLELTQFFLNGTMAIKFIVPDSNDEFRLEPGGALLYLRGNGQFTYPYSLGNSTDYNIADPGCGGFDFTPYVPPNDGRFHWLIVSWHNNPSTLLDGTFTARLDNTFNSYFQGTYGSACVAGPGAVPFNIAGYANNGTAWEKWYFWNRQLSQEEQEQVILY